MDMTDFFTFQMAHIFGNGAHGTSLSGSPLMVVCRRCAAKINVTISVMQQAVGIWPTNPSNPFN